MLTLLHISDLHFRIKDANSQFDRDDEIRGAIIRDLGIEERVDFDAMLVTGDLAYNGLTKELERADQWFDEVRKRIGLTAESVFIIPGNHDVNRDHVGETSVLMDAHKSIRGIADTEKRDANVEAKLKDTSWDFLRSIGEYRNFAATHDCPTTAAELAWSLRLPKKIDESTPVRLHGLNSAILSNKFDQRANLVVTQFQFHRLKNPEECVEIVMCHHPSSWLLDGNEVDDHYRRYVNLVLTGHEHQSRCFPQGNGLQVCAGAVHPSRGEANWQPSYNVIRLSVETNQQRRNLLIKVETRNWHKTGRAFVAAPWPGFASGHYEHRQDLPPVRIAESRTIPNTTAETPTITETATVPEEPLAAADDLAFASGRRKLIVHFFRLGIITRYEVVMSVGLYDESDEALEGQARWARIFERAEEKKQFPALWTAVASRDIELVGVPNPFTPGT